jgi:4-phytase/acid phosphatase
MPGSKTKQKRRFVCVLLALLMAIGALPSRAEDPGSDLRAVIIVSRHGVRAPLAEEIRDGRYNVDPWPAWPVAAGVLTPHGDQVMRTIGRYYRMRYATLLGNTLDCAHPHLYAAANNVQRTRASARALLDGLAPECAVPVHSLPDGKMDPLFNEDTFNARIHADLLAASYRGELGDHPEWWINGYRSELNQLQQILNGCEKEDCTRLAAAQLLDLPSLIEPSGAHSIKLQSPLGLGADFAEHFLLQYVEGMPMAQVGWGRVTPNELTRLLALNQSYYDFVLRTPYYSRIVGSDLAAHIDRILHSAAGRNAKPSGMGDGKTRFYLLLGHDTNLTGLSGLLNLKWALPDTALNVTLPGSSILLELYQPARGSELAVRALYFSESMAQMREGSALGPENPPSVVPLFIPGCSNVASADACTLTRFHALVHGVIDPSFVDFTIDGQRREGSIP